MSKPHQLVVQGQEKSTMILKIVGDWVLFVNLMQTLSILIIAIFHLVSEAVWVLLACSHMKIMIQIRLIELIENFLMIPSILCCLSWESHKVRWQQCGHLHWPFRAPFQKKSSGALSGYKELQTQWSWQAQVRDKVEPTHWRIKRQKHSLQTRVELQEESKISLQSSHKFLQVMYDGEVFYLVWPRWCYPEPEVWVLLPL